MPPSGPTDWLRGEHTCATASDAATALLQGLEYIIVGGPSMSIVTGTTQIQIQTQICICIYTKWVGRLYQSMSLERRYAHQKHVWSSLCKDSSTLSCGWVGLICLLTLALHKHQHKQNYKHTSVTASTATAQVQAVGHFILWVGGPSMSIDSGTNTNTAYYPVGGPGPSMSLKGAHTHLVSNTLVSERAGAHHPGGLLSVVICTIEMASYSNT